ncbi:MAG: hypothetical protein JWM11_8036 [Planctomycetaceae bacterium]|nr:hypothetical protein [Planctomycetaceae bacterium]
MRSIRQLQKKVEPAETLPGTAAGPQSNAAAEPPESTSATGKVVKEGERSPADLASQKAGPTGLFGWVASKVTGEPSELDASIGYDESAGRTGFNLSGLTKRTG